MKEKDHAIANLSPAYQLVRHVWDNSPHHGNSWTRLNGCLNQALKLAIGAGMRFDKGDFAEMHSKLRGGYWFGTDNDHSQGESFYALAVEGGNLSACQSFEAWKNRKPFMLDGKRLAIGSELPRGFMGGGRGPTKLTSFSADGTSFIACEYHWVGDDHKIKRRLTVTLEELKTGERAKRKPSPPAWGKKVIEAVRNATSCMEARSIARAAVAESTEDKLNEKFLTIENARWAQRHLKIANVPPAWAKALGLQGVL